jgi:hypothetical protein
LKDFQSKSAEQYRLCADAHFCNFHAWALARSGSAEDVAAIFLKMLNGDEQGTENTHECIFCRDIAKEEAYRLRELGGQLQRALFAQWMKSYGSLCLKHAQKLQEYVPLKHRRLVEEVVKRNRAELRDELEAFCEQLKQGIHEGGGLLGRAAEFLVGQRGL